MATCANCIHHSLCDYNTNVSGNGKIRLVYAEGADVKCSFFQNTADVVQKSEVERLQAEVDQLHALLECGVFANSVEDWQKFLNEKRAEVAREIFEDIDGKMLCFFPASAFLNAPNTTHYRLLAMLAELKKKYTEREP